MNILISIDDTDNADSIGTGVLSQKMCEKIADKWGNCTGITRHQLFVHPKIAYTSHNSSMCFGSKIDPNSYQSIIDFCGSFLEKESATGSDPGLCIAAIDRIRYPERLIELGLRAKKEVLTKSEVLSLSKQTEVHLSSHGGTGLGIIGALVGIGLRLSGNDGRFRGWHQPGEYKEEIRVSDLIKDLKLNSIQDKTGSILNRDEIIRIGKDRLKIVFRDNQKVLIVSNIRTTDSYYVPITEIEVKQF